jgi:hypothetical protein
MNDVLKPYADTFETAARTHGIDAGLLKTMAMTESSGNPNAYNEKSHATGLMQFVPATARELGIDPSDPHQAIDGAARYLKTLKETFGGDMTQAVAAYNWGMGNLQRKGLDRAPEETRNYVKKILGVEIGKKNLSFPVFFPTEDKVRNAERVAEAQAQGEAQAEARAHQQSFGTVHAAASDSMDVWTDFLSWKYLNSLEADPDWRQPDFAAMEADLTRNGLPVGHAPRLYEAKSQAEYDAILGRLHRENENQRVLAHLGWRGVGQSLIAGLTSPVNLALTVATAGTGLFASAGRAGYIAGQAALNAATTGLIESAQYGLNEIKPVEDILTAVASGFVLGGIGGGLTHGSVQARLNQRLSAHMYALGREVHETLVDTPGLSPRAATESVGAAVKPGAEFSIFKDIHVNETVEDHLNRLRERDPEAFAGFMRLDSAGYLRSLPQEEFRLIGQLLEDNVGLNKDLTTAGLSAERVKQHLSETTFSQWLMDANQAFKEYDRAVPNPGAGRELRRAQFDRDIISHIERGVPIEDPSLLRAAAATHRAFKAIGDRLVKAGLMEADQLRQGYIPRVWNNTAIREAAHTHTAAKVKELFYTGFRTAAEKKGRDMVTPELSANFAKLTQEVQDSAQSLLIYRKDRQAAYKTLVEQKRLLKRTEQQLKAHEKRAEQQRKEHAKRATEQRTDYEQQIAEQRKIFEKPAETATPEQPEKVLTKPELLAARRAERAEKRAQAKAERMAKRLEARAAKAEQRAQAAASEKEARAGKKARLLQTRIEKFKAKAAAAEEAYKKHKFNRYVNKKAKEYLAKRQEWKSLHTYLVNYPQIMDKLFRRMADGMVNTLLTKGLVVASRVFHGIPLDDAAQLRGILTELGLGAEEIEEAVTFMGMRKIDPGNPHLKHRADLDVDVKIATEFGELSLRDLFSHDLTSLVKTYVDDMAGLIAMKERTGIRNRSQFETLLQKAVQDASTSMTPAQLSRAVTTSRFAYDVLNNIPLDSDPAGFAVHSSRILRDLAFATASPGFTFAQLGETGNLIGAVGWKALLQHLPDVLKLTRLAEDGRLSNTYLRQIQAMTAAGTHRMRNWAPIVEDGTSLPLTRRIDKKMHHLKNVVADLSGFHYVTDTQTLMAAAGGAQRWADYAIKAKGDFDSLFKLHHTPLPNGGTATVREATGIVRELRASGLEDDELRALFRHLADDTKVRRGKGGKLHEFLEDQWEPELFNKFSIGLQTMAYRAIQENTYGGSLPFQHTWWGKLLMQFKSFGINAVTRQTLNGIAQRDITAGLRFLYGLGFGALGYMAQQYLSYGGTEAFQERMQPDKVAAAAIQRSGMLSMGPMVIDNVLPFLSGGTVQPLFANARSSGLSSTGLSSIPAGNTLLQAGRVASLPFKALFREDYSPSRGDVAAFRALIPGLNLPGMKLMTEHLLETLPNEKRPEKVDLLNLMLVGGQ